jgi:FtsP/CotA-like multicopper oxidase with cupredoxin domain
MNASLRSNRRLLRRGLALATGGVLALGAALATSVTPAAAADPPRNGIVCTTGGPAAKQPVFDLTTRTGYIDLPDGNTAFMWGYSNGFDPFQHPGPVLCVHEGDTVTVILHNTLKVATSMVFPGQDDVRADGVPSQPQVDTGTGMMESLAPGAAATSGTVTYTFTANRAGTYLYEAGTDPETQVRMGLFGALIVRPVDGNGVAHDDQAYDSSDSAFDPTEEFMVLLSEIDPYQHQAVERGKTFNITKYKARYWLINGRGYPDSIADNGASWLPNQPYGSLATVQPYDATTHPLSGVARYLSVGSEDYPFHPHGNNGLVIGRDGHELKNGTADLSMEKFAINIGPGQTWDVLFRWYDAEDYSPTNPVTVTVPSLANQVVGTFYSGSPYLGSTQVLPPGVQTLNQCGEYYIISHNHALYQITSWGVTMTGPITYMRIEPPTPNNCG